MDRKAKPAPLPAHGPLIERLTKEAKLFTAYAYAPGIDAVLMNAHLKTAKVLREAVAALSGPPSGHQEGT